MGSGTVSNCISIGYVHTIKAIDMVLVLWYFMIVNRTVCWLGRRKLRFSARKNYKRKSYVKHKLPVVPEADEGEVVQDISPVLQEVLKVSIPLKTSE